MGLREYTAKRNFRESPEPPASRGGRGKSLRFVVQQHAASRLHYDFRLELDGVLKSWAVPKGPSTDPSVRRLAMMVEDHPLDYRNFEGRIPEGNYGAGTVIVWDEGIYTPLEPAKSLEAQQQALRRQLRAGSLKFRLEGEKLRGEYALVHTRGMGEQAWLLIKHRDAHARKSDITKKNRSVRSGKTLRQLDRETAGGARTERSITAKNPDKGAPHRADVTKRDLNDLLEQAPRKRMPKALSPMLATLTREPVEGEDWQYEVKWDGYRALAFCSKGEVRLQSRNQKSFNEKFYPIREALEQWGLEGIVDGELVVLDERGLSRFGALQNWRSEADGELYYVVFDLLWLEGKDLCDLPLEDRRNLLRSRLPTNDRIRMSAAFETTAREMLDAAASLGMEGIMAKKKGSIYQAGIRSADWLKMKVDLRHEVVLGGFTLNRGSGKLISALLAGVFEQGKLRYIGKIGTGFSMTDKQELLKRFRRLVRKSSPFAELPDIHKPSRFRPSPPEADVTWLRPELVAEVRYTEITSDGLMRHPAFLGLREDKAAKEVGPERPRDLDELQPESAAASTKGPGKQKTSPSAARRGRSPGAGSSARPDADAGRKRADRKALLNPHEKEQTRSVNGKKLKFTNLDKVFWPEEGYTKRDMLNYYYQIAPNILPYLERRPQSLNRFPNGIQGKSFYQKDMTGKVPDWVELFPYTTSEGEQKHYMLCNREEDLLLMVNLGCIGLHPWSSRAEDPDSPDWCLIDLDPGSRSTFEDVIATAQATKKLLDEIGVPGYCKTSGSTGLHVYIPLQRGYGYDQSQLFGRWIATRVHEWLPEISSIERTVRKRRGKLYIDFLQNRPGATLAAPYSLRPRPGATVSMPLAWEEVKKGLHPTQFTMPNAAQRVRREGDLFREVLGKGVDLKKVLDRLPENAG